MRRFGGTWFGCAAGLMLALLLPDLAQATHIVSLTVGVEGGDTMTVPDAMLSCSGSAPNYTCATGGPIVSGTGMWTLDSTSLILDTDPKVTAITAVTNNTLITQTFAISVVLPIGVTFGPPSLIQGSIGGSLTDSSGDGAATVAAVSGDSIYKAYINSTVNLVPVRTLMDDPFSTSIAGTPFDTKTVGPQNFGITPNPPESVAFVTTTDIALKLRFTLTPGDSASFTSVFNVVPEPSTGVLMAIGLLVLGVRRRRSV